MAQMIPLPLTISCSSRFRLVLPFWYWLTRVVPDRVQRAVKWLYACAHARAHTHVCACACVRACVNISLACRLASDRELATAATLLSNAELAVMATSWLANDVASLTGPADVAAAAWLDSDWTLVNAREDRLVGRACSVTADDDFSAAETQNIHTFILHLLSSQSQAQLSEKFAGQCNFSAVCQPSTSN